MSNDAKRYYAMLGVDPSCADEEIRLAFRRRAKELHPDSESGSASAFIRLKRAYDTLCDPASRARYDRAGSWRPRRPVAPSVAPSVVSAGPPTPSRVRPPRAGGISFRRYAVAFVVMAGLSFGAIEVMIDLADVPAGSSVRAAGPGLFDTHPPAAGQGSGGDRGAAAPASDVARGGLWDPSTPDGTPRDTPNPSPADPALPPSAVPPAVPRR